MTDFRALCAELVAWADKASAHYYQSPDVLTRARAALAEPQPAADGEVAATGKPDLQDGPAVQSREPASVVEQPTDEELALIYHNNCRGCEFMDQVGFEDAARAVLARWGTPNLAETRSLLEPIPVSERLPEVGDCASWPDQPDADAWCWSGWNRTKSLLEPIPLSERLPEAGDCAPWCDCEDADPWCWCGKLADGGWEWFQFSASVLSSHFVFRGFTHWLPAHALPLPKEVE
jgi:hypothetical protein